jgi:hypothetical protein
VRNGDRTEEAKVVEVQHGPSPGGLSDREGSPPEQRMDVVSVDDIGAEAIDRRFDLHVGHAAAEQPPRREPSPCLGARGLYELDLVTAAFEQLGDVRNRALLAPLGSVSVVQQQNAHVRGRDCGNVWAGR